MSANDQLEREVEAALARLAHDAVPDSRRAPVPPWREEQRRSRTADVRRFGRATPWLVAAVLLVIAGLGVGAGVAFNSGAPDRGPAVTDPPSPVPSISWDVTITDAPRPSSHPTFSRGSNSTGPADGVDGNVAGIGTYGGIHAGMTRAQALAALGLSAADQVQGYGSTCSVAIPLPGTGDPGRPPRAIVDDSIGGTVIGFETASDAKDAYGNGKGTTLAQLEASYPNGQLLQRQAWTFTVLDGNGNGLGFAFGIDKPTATSTASYMTPGTADYASGSELCVG